MRSIFRIQMSLSMLSRIGSKISSFINSNVFQGQITKEATSLQTATNILLMKVSKNMTHLLQPLDLSVNGWVKQWMIQSFADWYPEQIRAGLKKSLEFESIKTKMTLTVMKRLHAIWLIELFHIMATDHRKRWLSMDEKYLVLANP